MFLTVKRWGNSYALRLTKADLARAGVKEGEQVEVVLRPLPTKRIDLSGMPTFRDERSDVSERHDEFLYGGR